MTSKISLSFLPAFWLARIRKPEWVFFLVLCTCILFAVQAGAVKVSWSDWSYPFLPEADKETMSGGSYVLWSLRLPRIFFAIFIGASLALSGTLTQGLFRNPLADPGLIGVTGGAACAVALVIIFLANSGLNIPMSWRYWLLPCSAFFGAVGVCFFLNRVSTWLTANSTTGLLLTGVAFNAFAAAVIGLSTYLATDEQLRSFSFWMLGSVSAASWPLAMIAFALLAITIYHAKSLSDAMNALALGEATAAHIGIDIRHLRTRVIVLVALLCGFAVAWCGMIGFIGLVAPHIVRTMMGSDHRFVSPYSMWAGAILLLLADTIARTIAIPAEIPVGVFTAFLGAPFFLYLLMRSRRQI